MGGAGGRAGLRIQVAETRIDFVSRMKVAAMASLAAVAVGLGALVYHGGPNWGVEFVGGTEVQMKFAGPIEPDDIRRTMREVGTPVESIQQLGLQRENEYLLRFSPDVVSFEGIRDFQAKLERLSSAAGPFQGARIQRIDFIGPKIGKELIRKAFFAIVIGWAVIMLYLMMRFEFSFALAAVIAIIHDILITTGALFLTDKEFTLAIVAALLTVIGYSVNDTIVIFDRIRENMKKAVTKGPFEELVNVSINQTLSRTVLTVLTVLFVLLALFLLGGVVIHDFAFTLMVGVTAGTYSSIFIAGSFVIYWRRRRPKAA